LISDDLLNYKEPLFIPAKKKSKPLELRDVTTPKWQVTSEKKKLKKSLHEVSTGKD